MTKYTTQENKSILSEELESKNLIITFNKLSGEIREMKCTLRKDILPPATKDDHLSQKKIRKVSPEVLTVWDIDNNGWRNIRWANIIKVEDEQQTERTDTGST